MWSFAKPPEAGYELRDSQDFVKADGMDYFLIFSVKANSKARSFLLRSRQKIHVVNEISLIASPSFI